MAWAWIVEKAGDFAFAEKIFKKAISKGAEPQKMLEDRHRQFQRRMSRHWLNANGGEHASDDHGEEDENDGALRRGRLTALTASGVRNNHRARAANETDGAHNRQPSNNANLTTSSRSRQRGSTSNTVKAADNGVFSIYVDVDANEDSHDVLDAPSTRQPIRLATDAERKKENTLDAEQWNKRGGLYSASTRDEDNGHRERPTGRPRPTNEAQKFEIFVDEGCSSNTNQGNPRFKNRAKVTATPHRSFRERLERGVVRACSKAS